MPCVEGAGLEILGIWGGEGGVMQVEARAILATIAMKIL